MLLANLHVRVDFLSQHLGQKIGATQTLFLGSFHFSKSRFLTKVDPKSLKPKMLSHIQVDNKTLYNLLSKLKSALVRVMYQEKRQKSLENNIVRKKLIGVRSKRHMPKLKQSGCFNKTESSFIVLKSNSLTCFKLAAIESFKVLTLFSKVLTIQVLLPSL